MAKKEFVKIDKDEFEHLVNSLSISYRAMEDDFADIGYAIGHLEEMVNKTNSNHSDSHSGQD